MKERPILFSGGMVRAILDGRKTMTRRVIKQQPEEHRDGACLIQSGSPLQEFWFYRNTPEEKPDEQIFCPYGKADDILWVKEAWCENFTGMKIHYKADGGESPGPKGPWRSSLFMPRFASRLTLEITAIKVERLQDITPEDIVLEGITSRSEGIDDDDRANKRKYVFLWDSLNAKRGFSWDVNPWAWVLSFKRVTP